MMLMVVLLLWWGWYGDGCDGDYCGSGGDHIDDNNSPFVYHLDL